MRIEEAITRDDVEAAAARLAGVAVRTPPVTSADLDAITDARVVLKPESLQRTGAFKFRGAFNAVARLPAGCPGVVTHSSGNHAAALALAARLHGLPAVVAMPHDVPAAKLAVVQQLGAEVVLYDRLTTAPTPVAEALALERGLVLVLPADHPDVIAGQGTVALELLADVPDLDAIVVPVSGGGLLAGCALAADGSGVPVIGVEPERADDFARSLVAGRRVRIPRPDTIADGLRSTVPGELTFPIALRHVQEVVTVTDDEIRLALRFLFERLKLVVEPSGAVALAAVLVGKVSVRRPAVVLSGGNVGLDQLQALLGTDAAPVARPGGA